MEVANIAEMVKALAGALADHPGHLVAGLALVMLGWMVYMATKVAVAAIKSNTAVMTAAMKVSSDALATTSQEGRRRVNKTTSKPRPGRPRRRQDAKDQNTQEN